MKPDKPKNNSVSWISVLAVLVGLPLLLAIVLSTWLGVPSETHESSQIFSHLRLEEVGLVEQNSLQYGKLFFCRLRVKPEDWRKFFDQLQSFETLEGKPDKPITLKLERAWWDLDETEDGTTWKKGVVTIWSPNEQPDLFYGAVRVE